MHDDRELEGRLRRLTAGLALGPEDETALATLRGADQPARRRRRWLRGAAVPVALAAALSAGAVAFASSPLGVILHFHPVDTRSGGTVTIGRAALSQQCPLPDAITLDEARQRAGFPILTAEGPGITLAEVRYQPPCGRAGDFVSLTYEDRGESFVLMESRGGSGPLQVDIKAYAHDLWRVVRVDGTDYAVLADKDVVAVAEFRRNGTTVTMTIGAKGGSYRPMSLAEWQDLVRHIG